MFCIIVGSGGHIFEGVLGGWWGWTTFLNPSWSHLDTKIRVPKLRMVFFRPTYFGAQPTRSLLSILCASLTKQQFAP